MGFHTTKFEEKGNKNKEKVTKQNLLNSQVCSSLLIAIFLLLAQGCQTSHFSQPTVDMSRSFRTAPIDRRAIHIEAVFTSLSEESRVFKNAKQGQVASLEVRDDYELPLVDLIEHLGPPENTWGNIAEDAILIYYGFTQPYEGSTEKCFRHLLVYVKKNRIWSIRFHLNEGFPFGDSPENWK